MTALNKSGQKGSDFLVASKTKHAILLISRLPVHGQFLTESLAKNYIVHWVGKNFNRNLNLINSLFILFNEFISGIHIFKKAHYPLVLVQFISLDGLVALLLKRIFRTKVVFFAIGSDILKIRLHLFSYPLMRYLILRSDFIFCANSLIKHELVVMGVNESKIKVIGSVVSFDDVEISASLKSFDIISVGNLDDNKDHLFLIKACEILGYGNVCLVGDGQLRCMLEAESRKRGVNVSFLGNIPRKCVLQELQKAKVYVHTAKSEGLPVSFLEAIFCGLPLVVLNYPYVKDIINRFDFELVLVDVGSPETLANAIKRVMKNYDLELTKAEFNRQKLLSFLSQNAFQLKTVLDGLITENTLSSERLAK